MPIKRKTTAKKAAPKKAAPLGPKAKLMKLQVTTLRNKAKKLGVKDITKKSKETLAQSIILAEARKKRGTAAGKRATAKRKAVRSTNPNRQINVPAKGSSSYWADASREALPPGRRTSKSGKVYYERRANRSDVPGTFAGSKKQMGEYNGWLNYETWLVNLYYDDLIQNYVSDLWSSGHKSRYDISRLLEEYIGDYIFENNELKDFAADMVNASLKEVSWRDLVESAENDLDESLRGPKAMRGSKDLTRQKLMDLLKTKYKFSFVRTTEDFNGIPGGVWVTGEGPQSIGGKKIYDYYASGAAYDLGVLKKFEQAINKLGWYSEWYDPGTIMIWPN